MCSVIVIRLSSPLRSYSADKVSLGSKIDADSCGEKT
jgi:hypothetical protein